jgi:hypothetical protein
MTDYILKLLGLDICADTIVGNEMLRGISGGQKKRVTTGELRGLGNSKNFYLIFSFCYLLNLIWVAV